MNKKLIILLFFLIIYSALSATAELVFKKDKATGKIAIVEEGEPAETVGGSVEKDYISIHQLPNDQRFGKYKTIVNESIKSMQEGQYEQAVEKLKAAIILEPDIPYAYDNLANAYYHLYKYEEAIMMSKAALKIDPQDANAYGNLGNIYYMLNKYQEAKINYQKAKELFQKNGDAEGVAKVDKALEKSFLP